MKVLLIRFVALPTYVLARLGDQRPSLLSDTANLSTGWKQ
jgi:hypothetical protein